MSTSVCRIPNASSDITYLVPEAFEPKRLIADILRTRFCVPDSIFLVEDVDIVHTFTSKRWRAIRLLLGDGELCIQALLSPVMHPFVDRGDIDFGSYVKLERFRAEWRETSDEDSASSSADNTSTLKAGRQPRLMVYLIVDSLVVVGWNNTLIDPLAAEKLETGERVNSADTERRTPGKDKPQPPELASETGTKPDPKPGNAEPQGVIHNQLKNEEEEHGKSVELDAEDDFEIMPISETRASQNRKELAKTRLANISHDLPSLLTTTTANTANLPWASNDPTRPLKLTNLCAIPNLPYKQNWSVNVLCVVSAISDVEPAGIPPYTQRQARLTDPSTDKHVLLTVFLDPKLFDPKVGSVVLLLGVKNHRFDGGSLKKYESDRRRTGDRWWYENPRQFEWCDVDSLLQWWAQNTVET